MLTPLCPHRLALTPYRSRATTRSTPSSPHPLSRTTCRMEATSGRLCSEFRVVLSPGGARGTGRQCPATIDTESELRRISPLTGHGPTTAVSCRRAFVTQGVRLRRLRHRRPAGVRRLLRRATNWVRECMDRTIRGISAEGGNEFLRISASQRLVSAKIHRGGAAPSTASPSTLRLILSSFSSAPQGPSPRFLSLLTASA
jgi:hypothetical protein